MFFGAGNLIFPLIVGHSAGNQTPIAIVGLCLSAVAFPFLGLIAMMFYKGNLRAFLSRLGKWPAFVLLLILQLTQGPMGCMPRLITLMHASVKSFFPELSLLVFSIVIAVILFLLTFRPQKIVDLLGVIMTPFLLLILTLLVVFGMWNAPMTQEVSGSSVHYFLEGIKGGYQTMDLIGSLLFATVILPHLAQGTEDLPLDEANRLIRRRMKGASLIAAGLLMFSYIGLCWVSSHYSWTLEGVGAPEDLLGAISLKIFGPFGSIVSTTAIFLACLTTAISLAAIFSDYLRKDLFREKISPNLSLILTLVITASIANLGFSGVVRLVGPILEILYPGLIVLCLGNIAYLTHNLKPVKSPVFFVLGFAAGGFFH